MSESLSNITEVAYPVADEAIERLAQEYMPLVIRGADDTEGYQAVHEARMVVKKKRVAIEKKRKELKADALEYGRRVDGEAKRLTSLIAPIEDHLNSEEDTYKAEKERIAQEAREKREAELRAVVDKFAAVGCTLTTYQVDGLPQEDLDRMYADAKTAHEIHLREEEQQRIDREKREAEEREQRLIEEQRLRAEREALEKQRAEQEAERQRLEQDLQKIKAERQHRETEERKQREAEAREADRKRMEAMWPDRKKLLTVSEDVESLNVPEVSEGADFAREQVLRVLEESAKRIRTIANLLAPK